MTDEAAGTRQGTMGFHPTTPGTAPLRSAIVGAGLMGRWHAHAVVRAGGTVAAIVDPLRQRAERLAGTYRRARLVPNLDSLHPESGIDVIHICTPLETHEALTRAALERGCHVLVEKPLAASGPVTRELLRLAESRGVLLCPVHQFLFQPGVLRLRELLPRILPLRHVDYVACSAGAVGVSGAERDRILLEILPHPLSLLERVLPGSVPDIDWYLQHPLPGELHALSSFGGASVSLLVSLAGRPTRNTLRLIGAGGTVHLDLFHGFAVAEPGSSSRRYKIVHPFVMSGATALHAARNLAARVLRAEPAYPGLRELIRRFYAAVRDDGPAPISAGEVLAVASARDRLATRLGTFEE
jgi:predicted dehydrogenase